jgi:hypothetical protein
MSTIQTFDYSIDLKKALLWQYDKAENIQGMFNLEQEFIDEYHTQFWEYWYRDVFNLDTANEFGLNVWSIILDLPFDKGPKPDPEDKPIFGFGSETEIPNGHFNFDNGVFTNSNGGIRLTIEQKRIALKLRYFRLTCRAAIPQSNRFLKKVFADYGLVYLLDGLHMDIVCVFTFEPDPRLLTVIQDYDLIPRGSGVKIRYEFASRPRFGFGSETIIPNAAVNFDNAPFIT